MKNPETEILPSASPPAVSNRRDAMTLVTLLLLIVQCGLTWKLWTPQDVFPQVPWLANFKNLPAGVQWVLLACSVACLMLTGINSYWIHRDRTRQLYSTCGMLAFCLAAMILLDQNRLQAWMWQILLYALVLGLTKVSNAAQTLRAMRAITISLYFYSAVSKLDHSFLTTYGNILLEALFSATGMTIELSPDVKRLIVLGFPLIELCVALLLCFRLTRILGYYLSLAMHLGLIITLGPGGLNHHLPVLVWNFFFIIQNTILFGGNIELRSSFDQASLRLRFALLLSLILPAGEWIDRWDLWPGWSLYSSRGARVQLFIEQEKIGELPATLQKHLYQSEGNSRWAQLDLHRWSLASLNAPAYPEDRFQLGVARTVIDKYQLEDGFLIVHRSTANRWNGQRRRTLIESTADLDDFTRRYWINTQGRF